MYHKQLIIEYGCKVIACKSHYPKEGPWKLPKGWCWTKLGEISDYGKCVTVPVSAIQDDEWVLELEDIEKDTGRILKQITKKERPINGSRHAFTKNQILYSKLRTYLNKVLIAPNNGYCTTEIIPISPQSGILPEYLNLVLRSPYFQEYTAQCGYGVKMPRLGTSDAIKSLIPVPPYGEQQRIIESANKLADITERIQSEKEHLSEHITGCKSRILELAIYGKLVPQDPAEEPAIELLKRIKPDFTPSHNLHYETQQLFTLPNGWEWCSVKDYSQKVTDYVASGSFASLKENVRYYKQPNYAILIKTKDFANNFSEDLTYTDEKGYNFLKNSNLYGGELVFSNVGSVGKIFKVPHLNIRMSLAPNAIMVKFHQDDQSAWFERVFQSPFGQESLRAIASATAIMKFNKTDFGKLLIPVPPVSEQKRILDAIDAFLAQLDCINDTE